MLVISEAMKGNHAYFAAIQEEMDAGGYEAMLHDLLAIDLTDFLRVSRDTMMPSYVFFGFNADTAIASYLFNVIDRAMATALTAFRTAQPRLHGVGLRDASRSFQQGMAARVADRLDAMTSGTRRQCCRITLHRYCSHPGQTASGLRCLTVIYVTAIDDAESVGRAHREVFGGVRPASTMVQVVALVRPEMRVEIEAYAVIDAAA
jgi:hypothetical protein